MTDQWLSSNFPCNINVYSTHDAMRIKYMITQGEFSRYFNKNSSVLVWSWINENFDLILTTKQ